MRCGDIEAPCKADHSGGNCSGTWSSTWLEERARKPQGELTDGQATSSVSCAMAIANEERNTDG